MNVKNYFSLCGRMVADVETTKTAQSEYARFTLAVGTGRKGQDGKEGVDFVDCIAWGKTAALIANYVKKGREILVAGRITTSMQEKDGKRRKFQSLTVEEVAFLSSANNNGNSNGAKPAPKQEEDLDLDDLALDASMII